MTDNIQPLDADLSLVSRISCHPTTILMLKRNTEYRNTDASEKQITQMFWNGVKCHPNPHILPGDLNCYDSRGRLLMVLRKGA